MARQTLGRGLNALLGDAPVAETEERVSSELDIDLIEPNPQQPRTRFNEDELEELTRSIRINGIIQPIVVRRVGKRYQIVAGERRWRAAQRAELHRIPAVVRDVSDEKMLELALIENIQRQELNPMEEARAYRTLIANLGQTQESVADRVGKSRAVIATAVRLLKLPDELQKVLEQGNLSAGHGRALLMIEDLKLQLAAAKETIEKGWSVRDLEKAIKHLSRNPQPADNKDVTGTTDPNIKVAETKLKRTLNTNVKIIPGKKGIGGRIEIEYYSLDDLDRIYDLLIKK